MTLRNKYGKSERGEVRDNALLNPPAAPTLVASGGGSGGRQRCRGGSARSRTRETRVEKGSGGRDRIQIPKLTNVQNTLNHSVFVEPG